MKLAGRTFMAFGCACIVALAHEAASAHAERELADLSLEELMNEPITSAGKREQRMADVAAAIHVLTSEDIRRAGHTSIAEALRMVPGLSVAQLDGHTWVVTARGFAAQWAGKLLVLVDGRTIYEPFYSGVQWVLQDLMLEDLDRVEVIRGPGATLWGVNAVNGVINIITKKASDTQGGLAVASGGPQLRGSSVRYGGETDRMHYRAYASYSEGDELVDGGGRGMQDGWGMRRAGFRTEWRGQGSGVLTLQGDIFAGEQDTVAVLASLTPPSMTSLPQEDRLSGGNLLARWTMSRSERSNWSLQAYYDRSANENLMLATDRDIFDLELQHALGVGSRHSVVYGAGLRLVQTEYVDSFFLPYPSDRDSVRLVNAFLQDEIALLPERLALTLGAKIEHADDGSQASFQPNVRVRWTPRSGQSLWASVSRADRVPTPSERRLRVNYTVFDTDGPGPRPPTVLAIVPNPELDSEELIAYDVGYRLQAGSRFFLDVAGFVNVYERLIATESSGTSFEVAPAPHVLVADRYTDSGSGRTYGLELAPAWQVTDSWKLAAGYTWLRMSLDAPLQIQEGDSPRHQVHLRSFKEWSGRLSLDAALYYVDELPSQGTQDHVRLDARLGWHATDSLELSLSGTNLLDAQHLEFRSYSLVPSEVRRSFHGKIVWRF